MWDGAHFSANALFSLLEYSELQPLLCYDKGGKPEFTLDDTLYLMEGITHHLLRIRCCSGI